MPCRDKTGPSGQGPGTGGGFGNCPPSTGGANTIFVYGVGRGGRP